MPPPWTYTPYPLLEVGRVIIAPFFADVDARNPASLETQYGTTTVDSHEAFCVRWVQVGYFDGRADKLDDLHFSFSIGGTSHLVTSTSDATSTGCSRNGWRSGGIGGLGGAPARVGFSNGIDHAYEMPGSGVSGVFWTRTTRLD